MKRLSSVPGSIDELVSIVVPPLALRQDTKLPLTSGASPPLCLRWDKTRPCGDKRPVRGAEVVLEAELSRESLVLANRVRPQTQDQLMGAGTSRPDSHWQQNSRTHRGHAAGSHDD